MKRMILMGLMGLIGLLSLIGCKSIQYVPVETVRTETVHHTDTVKETNTINNEKETVIREARPEDSLMLAKLGIKLQSNERMLILLQRELAETKNELKESHSKDSVRCDTIKVPYPVEKQLGRFDSFCVDYGKVMVGVSIGGVLLFILIILARIKGWKWPI